MESKCIGMENKTGFQKRLCSVLNKLGPRVLEQTQEKNMWLKKAQSDSKTCSIFLFGASGTQILMCLAWQQERRFPRQLVVQPTQGRQDS